MNPGLACTFFQFSQCSSFTCRAAREAIEKLLPTWLTSQNAPDVATWFAGYRMQSFAAKGLLEPLDEVFPGGTFEKELR